MKEQQTTRDLKPAEHASMAQIQFEHCVLLEGRSEMYSCDENILICVTTFFVLLILPLMRRSPLILMLSNHPLLPQPCSRFPLSCLVSKAMTHTQSQLACHIFLARYVEDFLIMFCFWQLYVLLHLPVSLTSLQ